MLYRAPNCVGSPHWLLALCCLAPSIHEKTTNYKIYQGTTLLRRQMSLFLIVVPPGTNPGNPIHMPLQTDKGWQLPPCNAKTFASLISFPSLLDSTTGSPLHYFLCLPQPSNCSTCTMQCSQSLHVQWEKPLRWQPMLSQFVEVLIAPVWKTKKSQPFQI